MQMHTYKCGDNVATLYKNWWTLSSNPGNRG